MSEWLQCKLRDACASIDYGYTAPAVSMPVGPHFLRITDIVDGHIDWASVPFIDVDEATAKKYKLLDGDIVLARTGASTGASMYITDPPEALFASYLVRLKIKPEFNSRYIAYYLKSEPFWSYIHGVLGDKSAQPNASASTMTQAPLRAPRNVEEQHAIATFLGMLDDKIDLNRCTNATLIEMSRTIFRDWFVNFGPVHVKSEGRQPIGIARWIANLFPDALDRDLRPVGWHVGRLADFADVVMGASPSGDTYNINGLGIPLVNGPAEYGQFFLESVKWTTAPTRLSRRGDFILCVRGSTTGRYVFSDGEYCLGRGVAAIRAKHGIQSFVDRLVIDNMPRLLMKTTGSVFPNLASKDLQGFEVIKPPEALVTAFCKIVDPLRERCWRNVEESKTLASLRDMLLPRLLSGEIRLREAEKLVEAAA